MATVQLPEALTKEAYKEGAKVRMSNRPKTCPIPSIDFKSCQLRYWWYAGWNDTDMELGDRK